MTRKRISAQKESTVLRAHRKNRGKIALVAKVPLKTKKDLALQYTPGVGEVCARIARQGERAARAYTWKKNTVAVVSDGSAVLGLGNIGALAALPVMEGKALIFKKFANIDAVPIVLSTQNSDEIVNTIKAIAPSFAGINIEDIAAPQCFDIERRLIKELSIPVMHDDQHGTAIVVLAGLINATKVVHKNLNKCTVVVSGVGAAGIATMRLLKKYAPKVKIIAVDSQGIVHSGRALSQTKLELIAERIINDKQSGTLSDATRGSDIFIGVSRGNTLTGKMVSTMNAGAIVFALANPTPEILPSDAYAGGARVVATGRSDFPNQINNALVFPGVFRGALDAGVAKITGRAQVRVAVALAQLVARPTAEHIIPDIFDKRVVRTVARAIAR